MSLGSNYKKEQANVYQEGNIHYKQSFYLAFLYISAPQVSVYLGITWGSCMSAGSDSPDLRQNVKLHSNQLWGWFGRNLLPDTRPYPELFKEK